MRSPILALVSLVSLGLATRALAEEPLTDGTEAGLPVEIPAVPQVPRRLPIVFTSDQVVENITAAEDLFAMAQQITVDGPVADNAFLMSQISRIDAPVQGDLFAMAETVIIEAPVGGDVFVFAKHVEVTGKGSVGGHLRVWAAEAEISGPIGGDVSVGAGELILDAPIGGDVSAEVGVLQLRGGSIGGDLSYSSPSEVAGLDQAVAGVVTFTQQLEEQDDEAPEPEPGILSQIFSWTMWTGWSYGSKLLVGFAFLALGGEAAGRMARTLLDQPARAMGLGFVVTSVLPAASLVAMAMILPLPLGLLGLLAFAVALYAGQILSAQAVGDLILRRVQPGALGSPYISMAVGMVPLVLAASLPWLGIVVWFAATVAGVGALWLGLRRMPVA